MKVTFFFRKKRKNNHSIERVFDSVIKKLPSSVGVSVCEVKHGDASPKSLLRNMLDGKNNQGSINHITGDIHYVNLLFSGTNTILTIHDIESIVKGNIIKRILFKWIWFILPIRKSRFVTVISNATKRKLLDIVKVGSNKVKVIPNPVTSEFDYLPRESLSEKPVILQIGTKENKNLQRLIPAIKNIECHLIIVGKLNDQLEGLLSEYNLSYENHENLSDEELLGIYKRSEILTFVSLFEGFGLPILEAQCSGIPVITSNISSMPEVAGDGALIVNPYDEEDIRKGIQKIIDDHSFRKDLIERGRTNSLKYDATKIAQLYFELYQQINEDQSA